MSTKETTIGNRPPARELPATAVFANDYSAYAEEIAMINVGSTLSVLGALLLVAQERFKMNNTGQPDDSLPYVWCGGFEGDPHLEDPHRSTIHLAPANDNNLQCIENKPSVLIGRAGDVNSSNIMLGDKAGETRKTGKKIYYSMDYAPFYFECRSFVQGEAEYLGNVMYQYLMQSHDVLRKFFHFHEMGPFALSVEKPMQKQSTIYSCTVSFRCTWENRWAVTPRAPLHSSLSLSIFGTDDPEKTIDELLGSGTAPLERIIRTTMAHPEYQSLEDSLS